MDATIDEQAPQDGANDESKTVTGSTPNNNLILASPNLDAPTSATSPISSSTTTTQQQQQSAPLTQEATASTTSTSRNAPTKQHSHHHFSQLPMTTRKKLSHLRAHIKRQASKAARSRLDKRSSSVSVSTPAVTPAATLASSKTPPSTAGQAGHSGNDGTSSRVGVGEQLGNIKQKLVALIKKFRTDDTDFDSEEQYRETLERELMKAAAVQGPKAIEELLDEEIGGVEGDSGSEPDSWDNISETSTPKPSLRPFFSSTTLDKI